MRIIPSGVQQLLLRVPSEVRQDDLFKPGSASGALFSPIAAGNGQAAFTGANQSQSWHSVAPRRRPLPCIRGMPPTSLPLGHRLTAEPTPMPNLISYSSLL